MITKYRYNKATNRIEVKEFASQTNHFLKDEKGNKVSKKGGYQGDWHDTYKACHEAATALLQERVAEAKDRLAALRKTLDDFSANVSKP